MNKQQLANKIWESANKMRSKIEANEYKDYILGFIFYKYLSDREVSFLREQGFSEEDIQEVSEEDSYVLNYIQNNLGYFIAYKDLFSTWLAIGKDFHVSNVTDALSAFRRLISPTYKKVFDKIFDTLQTGLSKLGESSGARTKAISGLLALIKDIPMDGKQDYDVLGFIYEYLISNFAANAGKKAGEFYTPHEVSLLMSEIVANHLKDRKEIKIYDPTSGSGSLLINIGKSVSKYIVGEDNIKYYAQELKENTYNLTRMNLVMRGIKPDNIATRNGDTLEEDWPYFDEADPVQTYDPLYVDAVVSNPPYSQAWESAGKDTDPRYARFGLAPKGKADYAFLLHDLYHLKPDGIMTIVLPHGVLFRGGVEGEIRKNLIENNHIDSIIGLPANIFFGTGIPTIIMVLKQSRECSDILIVDASKGFIKEGKNNRLRTSDIKKIVDSVVNREDIEKYSRVISRDEIRKNDYNLNIPRYVDSSEDSESWDIFASMYGGIPMSEIAKLHPYWNTFPSLKQELFSAGDISLDDEHVAYVDLVSKDMKDTIKQNADVLRFHQQFKDAFESFGGFLYERLLKPMPDNISFHIMQEEQLLSKDIFHRLEDISASDTDTLLDKYEAYQIFSDAWNTIANDLEIIQTEGFNAVKMVDPNLVLKKKNGIEQEVQEGWIGRIIPFELVQTTLLSEETTALKQLESKLAQIPSMYEEILDSLSEDEKESCADLLTEEGDAFILKDIPKKIKEWKADTSEEIVALRKKLEQVERISKNEKEWKNKLKEDSTKLHTKTKETIENLSDAQAKELLDKKWIQSLTGEFEKLPEQVIDTLVAKLSFLADKYESTLLSLEDEIQETEQALAAMIDDLRGNEFDMKGLREFQALLKKG